MGHEGSTAEHPVAGHEAPGRGSRAAIVAVAARIVLILAWAAIVFNAVTEAREASLGDLGRDLSDGQVTAIEVERADPGTQAQGTFLLRWDAGLVDSFTRYEYDESAGVDEAAGLLEQARSDGVPVQVVSIGQYPPAGDVTKDGWLVTTFGPWVGLAGLLVIGASLTVLISGPQPWFATKWAWFWLVWAVPVLWLVFLALEPRPLRLSVRWAAAGRPAPLLGDGTHRLTGGWAFVIAWVTSAVLTATGLPLLSAWH